MSDIVALKEKELAIFKEFIEICRKNSLNYYVIGGTLLGTIRHNGFIPWDDDIDVGMPREDYDFFLRIAQNSLSENLFLQTHETDPEYLNGFAKIRDSNTTFLESSCKDFKINHGVFIDVFPLDFYPDEKIRLFKLKNIIYKARISREFNANTSIKLKILQFIALILCPSLESAISKRDKLYTCCKKSDNFVNHCGAWGDKEITPVEWFNGGEAREFEDVVVNVPKDYDKYLKKVYGDYMKFPPKSQRVAHHYCEVIDCNTSYIEYINK